jgi:diacylglycerol O-acyltransferase / wax synthase
LSGLDGSFLAFETPTTYMHVAVTAVFEVGPIATPKGGVDIKRIRAHIGSRLRLIPRYRQRVRHIPLVNDAVWVDDDDFDLNYHVRHTSLPRPGGERQLHRLCAEILERPLDRRRPLWETWIIEGLIGGRFAMLAKVHHCMVDGIAGVELLAALLSMEPDTTVEKAERWTPRPEPNQRELLRDELRRRARASLRVARSLRRAMESPRTAGQILRKRASAVWGLMNAGLSGALPMPFNKPISPHRRVDWLSFDLGTVKQVKTHFGGTINDVVLTTVAGAVRKFLAQRKQDPGAPDLRVVVPVSVRTADERGAMGNRVSVWVVSLPLEEEDPRSRMGAVCEITASLKENEQSLGAEVLTQAAEWTTANLLNLAVRFINRSSQYNLIVTNVPGPPVPFYLLGSRMLSVYPHVPLFENQGLGVALLSYAGNLYWGVTGDWDQVPDLQHFSKAIMESFSELCDAAGVGTPAVAATKRPRLISRRRDSVTTDRDDRPRIVRPARPRPRPRAAAGS